jgi:hypothetical protein
MLNFSARHASSRQFRSVPPRHWRSLAKVVGPWSRWAIRAEGLLVTVLLFGTAIRSDWTVVSHQMIYILFVFFLLAVEDWDYFSVDAWLARRRRSQAVLI